jgi:hypothetical protein
VKKPDAGTEQPRAFAIECGPSWDGWAKRRTDAELEEIRVRLVQLRQSFGQPHLHGGLGLRRLTPRLFEFRISKGIRVVFAFIKPRTFQLAMTGNHTEVRAWLKENT